jgi:hypothetical protein
LNSAGTAGFDRLRTATRGQTRINQSSVRASTAFTSDGLEDASDNGAAGRTGVAPGMHNDVRVLTALMTITAVALALLV